MRQWAEIFKHQVIHISEHDHDVEFSPPLLAVEVTGMNPMPAVGWWWDGTTFHETRPNRTDEDGLDIGPVPMNFREKHTAASKADEMWNTLKVMEPDELKTFIQSKISNVDAAKMFYVIFTQLLK
jgi:hypothetical protein